MAYDVLFSFVGNRDPYIENSDDEFGPVLSLLAAESYSRVYLICTGSDYIERARTVEKIAQEETENRKFNFIDLDLESPIDYEEIYAKLSRALKVTSKQVQTTRVRNTVLLDPGTPQMQTVWFLLVKSGEFPARLVQGIPPRFAGGTYKVREVNPAGSVLPDIVIRHGGKNTGGSFEETPSSFVEDLGDRWISSADLRIIGSSPVLLSVLEQAKRFAKYSSNILLRGETGSGKGVIAKYIHQLSPRSNKPLANANCSSISPTIAESTLFGHTKGAYTDAGADRLGLFRSADGGTVFLDEIGDLPLEIQPKLLKVIEEKTLIPLGSDREFKVDVRIIAATNRNLEELIEEGKFRMDLYQRLNEMSLEIPALRERGNDIMEIGQEFLNEWNREFKENRQISHEAWDYLLRYGWPGNIRELYNAIRNMCGKTGADVLKPEFLPPQILNHFKAERSLVPLRPGIPDEGVDVRGVLFEIERWFYQEALKKAGGNGEQAAKLLSVNGPAFRKACKERFGLAGD